VRSPLLSPRPNPSVLVITAIMLTKLNNAKLLRFHRKTNTRVIVCFVKIQVPYGEVQIMSMAGSSACRRSRARAFYQCRVYFLKPECLDCIPKNDNLT
jgi:hypothetical protein